ncbi:MAG: Gfo/Idh/MocA family oxidoreductase [Rubellimicrobium sp.]|nr:Gfo/Idh/MocA family oxidoreductase [Rubellimicrobium sp.]
MKTVVLVGCGYVADLYMRSFAVMKDMRVTGAHDRDPARQAAFCAHWHVPPLPDMAAVIAQGQRGALVLNLTNPGEHAGVSRALLSAGVHVWSEKPMTLTMAEARDLHALARARGVHLASAPSSVLSEAAQALGRALRAGIAGRPVVVYAEMDDGFIPQAPVALWRSESGAPWPVADEFRTGATLEHAGYWLSWLIAFFGPVRTVVAASAELVPDKPAATTGAPDFSVATLFFHSGVVARLTCSIAAPHDHRLRVVGEKGTLTVPEAWDNAARVTFRRRLVLRRRLIESPIARRVVVSGPAHPHVAPRGAAAMNFALGPHEMAEAIARGRAPRLAGDYALHLTEVTLAIHNAGEQAGAQAMTTSCAQPEPMPWAV